MFFPTQKPTKFAAPRTMTIFLPGLFRLEYYAIINGPQHAPRRRPIQPLIDDQYAYCSSVNECCEYIRAGFSVFIQPVSASEFRAEI
jgi:hypothetical protein